MGTRQSRYFETVELMDDALLALFAKKDLEYITVKEICRFAGVNRSTFYLHYETIDDLLTETAELVNRRFVAHMGLEAKSVVGHIGDAPHEDLLFARRRFLIPYLQFIQENQQLFSAMVKRPGALKQQESARSLKAHVLEPVLDRFNVPEADRPYLLAFYLKGIMAIVEVWVTNGCTDPAEHIARLIEGVCAGGGSGSSGDSENYLPQQR